MKKMINIALLALGASVAQATLIVDLSGNFNTGTSRPARVSPVATLGGEVDTFGNLTTAIVTNSAPCTGGLYTGQTFYGMFRHEVAGGVTSHFANTTFPRVDAAPDSIQTTVARNEAAGSFDSLFVFKQADFLGGLNTGGVEFDTDSAFVITVAYTATAKSLRAVVQNKGSWYISQTEYNAPATAGTRTILSDARNARWAVWNPSNLDVDVLDFSTTVAGSTFENIEAVGIYNHLSSAAAQVSMATTITSIQIGAVAAGSGGGGESDADSDGIPDSWETQHFGGTTNANPSSLSANGINTVMEAYVAGLNPTNPTSVFLISDLRSLTSENILQWNAVSGRVYSVYWTTNLLSGFQSLETNIVWPQSSWTDEVHSAQGAGFYRINVLLGQ